MPLNETPHEKFLRTPLGEGAQFPGRRMTAGSAAKSQQYQQHFLQYITSASKRRQVQTWGRQACFLTRAPPNVVTPLLER